MFSWRGLRRGRRYYRLVSSDFHVAAGVGGAEGRLGVMNGPGSAGAGGAGGGGANCTYRSIIARIV